MCPVEVPLGLLGVGTGTELVVVDNIDDAEGDCGVVVPAVAVVAVGVVVVVGVGGVIIKGSDRSGKFDDIVDVGSEDEDGVIDDLE